MIRVLVLVLVLVIGVACQRTVVPAAGNGSSTDEPVTSSAALPAPLTPPFRLGAGFPTGEVTTARLAGGLREGQPVPGFAMSFPDGTTVSLADLKGRAFMLNFWATWCGPCRHEIPLILDQQAAHLDEWLVLAVNVKEPMQKVAAFAEEFDMQIPIVLDPNGDVVDLFQVRGFPTSVFVDAEGRLVATWTGVLDEAKLTQLLEASLP